ncbi:hypothetical protein SAMN04490248_101375 [Salinihabitans flavidus]|uniref:Aminoglycoside phosphotransferase domain-containing protein n=2 Tax=Salinihabitans flavidus TaxID=569882 RepID=A0A1H8M0F3_9RHOB|nr:hypothetical protein SAMN04490248_101375 [Salinihabitans flavidus]
MDAPSERGEDVRPFARISRYLRALGLSAPDILAEDDENGLLLLEDLGDALFVRVVARNPALERPLYEAATDLLADLHRADPPENLEVYDPMLMSRMAALAWRWYRRAAGLVFEDQAQAFEAAFYPLLDQHAGQADVLIQRDYHAENLIWLPDRSGVARVGLLDFQDAMIGHRAYDLVSLLQDARRDVPRETEAEMTDRYISRCGVDRDAFLAAYHVLGAQRNLRILGVFARLSLQSGKPHYVNLIPRVWNLLERDLAHPALHPIAETVRRELPAPTDSILTSLKNQCATIPTP